MGPRPMPDAEVEVDAGLAAALIAAQHPDLVGPLEAVAEGWDNVVLRLGEALAVRLPRRRLGAELVARETTWLPRLAPRLPVEVPEPVRVGRPDPALGYPFPWAIVRWVEGEAALVRGPGAASPLDDGSAVDVLVAFLQGLWSVSVPTDPPRNPWRGVPLSERDQALTERLDLLPGDIDRAVLVEVWADALAAAPAPVEPRWVHGDLHPGNLVVRDGRLVGVIDWGDLTIGDTACDLGVAWMLLGADGRDVLFHRLGLDDDTWRRARGNALAHAVAVLTHSADAPAMAAMAHRTLDAVLSDGPR